MRLDQRYTLGGLYDLSEEYAYRERLRVLPIIDEDYASLFDKRSSGTWNLGPSVEIPELVAGYTLKTKGNNTSLYGLSSAEVLLRLDGSMPGGLFRSSAQKEFTKTTEVRQLIDSVSPRAAYAVQQPLGWQPIFQDSDLDDFYRQYKTRVITTLCLDPAISQAEAGSLYEYWYSEVTHLENEGKIIKDPAILLSLVPGIDHRVSNLLSYIVGIDHPYYIGGDAFFVKQGKKSPNTGGYVGCDYVQLKSGLSAKQIVDYTYQLISKSYDIDLGECEKGSYLDSWKFFSSQTDVGLFITESFISNLIAAVMITFSQGYCFSSVNLSEGEIDIPREGGSLMPRNVTMGTNATGGVITDMITISPIPDVASIRLMGKDVLELMITFAGFSRLWSKSIRAEQIDIFERVLISNAEKYGIAGKIQNIMRQAPYQGCKVALFS